MVGIPIPPKGYGPRERIDSRSGAAEEGGKERKRHRKNEYGRRETRRMTNALELIRRHLGIEGATKAETLAALVEEGEYRYHPNSMHDS
jgi:hypothetical protein